MIAGILLSLWGLVTQMVVYFCLGFTAMALASHVDDGIVDITGALIVGASFAFFQIARFVWYIFHDARDGHLWARD